jgi:hypothetical protein
LPDVVVAEDTDVGVGEGLLGLLELGVHGTPGLASVQRNMGINRPQLDREYEHTNLFMNFIYLLSCSNKNSSY